MTRLLLIILCLATMLTGCVFLDDSQPQFLSNKAFIPHTVELLPSFTRLDNQPQLAEDDQDKIDVYVRLLDQYGDPLKAIGTFRFELFQYRAMFRDPRGKRYDDHGLQEFTFLDIAVSQKAWDNITQSYYFQLDKPALPSNWKKIVLSVTYLNPQGYRLENMLTIDR